MRCRWPRQSFSSSALEIIDGDRGKEYPKHSDFSDSGYCLFLNTGNVRPDGFDFSNCQFISEEKDQRLRKGKLMRHDLVMTTRGTIGNVAYYDDNVPYENLRINSGMVVFRANPAQLHPRFLYHFLRSPDFIGQTISMRSGVAQPQFPIRDIRRVELPTPDLATQTQIASLLSAYDDLIENDRRRMVLLEEAARQLYREWFVHLRYPGHEHTRITNGVPEGWTRMPLGDRVTLNYGKALKADHRVDGPFPVYGSSGIVGTHDKALVKGPGIIVGRKGNVGSVYWCAKDFYPIDTVYFLVGENSNLWLYYALQHMHFISTDVAVPGLNRDFAYSRPLIVPVDRILRGFLEAVMPMHEYRDKLEEITEKLRAARDLLLPRLMSGEIPV